MVGTRMGVSPLKANRRARMAKKKNELAIQSEAQISNSQIFDRVSNIIESRKYRAGIFANSEITIMY